MLHHHFLATLTANSRPELGHSEPPAEAADYLHYCIHRIDIDAADRRRVHWYFVKQFHTHRTSVVVVSGDRSFADTAGKSAIDKH